MTSEYEIRVDVTTGENKLLPTLKDAQKETDKLDKGTKKLSGSFDSVKESVLNFRNVLVATGVYAVANFFKKAIAEAANLETSFIGLSAQSKRSGESISYITNAAKELASDGIIPLNDVAESLKDLLSTGIGAEKSIQTFKVLRDIAVNNRKENQSLGDAIKIAAKGIENFNQKGLTNISISKKMSDMVRDYATSIGKTVDQLTDQEKRQVVVNNLLRIGKGYTGEYAESTKTFTGALAGVVGGWKLVLIEIGSFVTKSTSVIDVLKTMAKGAKGIASALREIREAWNNSPLTSWPALMAKMNRWRTGEGAKDYGFEFGPKAPAKTGGTSKEIAEPIIYASGTMGYLIQNYESFGKKFYKNMFNNLSQLPTSLAASFTKGAAGVQELAGAISTAIGDAFLPGLGQAIAPIVQMMGLGPEQTRKMIREFADAVPIFIQNFIDSIPVIIEEIIASIPKISYALTTGLSMQLSDPKFWINVNRALIDGMIRGAKSFADELVRSAGRIVQAIVDGIKEGLKEVSSLGIGGKTGDIASGIVSGGWMNKIGKNIWGTGTAGTIASWATNPLGAAAELIGFAEGGVVPPGYPNDSYPARLSSGEGIASVNTMAKLDAFLSRPQTEVKVVSFQVNNREFAKAVLELNRTSQRIYA